MTKNCRDLLFLLFPCLLISLLTGCATAPRDGLGQVEIGMEKTDVLELMGNPRHTWQNGKKEFWRYSFYDGHHETIKEVVFIDGKVVTFGTPATTDESQLEEMSSVDDLKDKSKRKMKPPQYKEL